MTGPRATIKVLEPKEPPVPTSLEEPTPKKPDTPPISTNEPPNPPTEPDKRDQLIETQNNVIREMRQAQQRLEQRIDQISQPPAAPAVPEPTTAEKDKKFWESPSAMIKEEMKTAVEPLYEFVNEMKSGTDYDRAKALLKEDPTFGPVLIKAESYVDELMKNQEPTIANLKVVLYGIRGAAEMGELDGLSFKEQAANAAADLGIVPTTPVAAPTEVPTQPTEVDMSTVPAHLKPSAPTPPQASKKRTIDPNKFSENERRLARERGMSLEDYADWLEVPADEVVSTKIGQGE